MSRLRIPITRKEREKKKERFCLAACSIVGAAPAGYSTTTPTPTTRSPAPSSTGRRRATSPGTTSWTTSRLVIWGERDSYLGSDLAEPDHDDVPNLDRVERLPDASHWVHHDEAERVNQLLIDFFAPAR
jgi:pimeloyl-ACP methyl ester carboxylesterase